MVALHRAAKAGEVAAQERLATHYFIGDGVPFSQEKAFYWYGRAAAQNSHYGLYNLGHAYEFGTGVAPDIHQSAHYYERAARLNNASAQSALARLHAGTLLGKPDFAESHKWQILANAHGWRLEAVDYGAVQWLTPRQRIASEAAAAALQAKFDKL